MVVEPLAAGLLRGAAQPFLQLLLVGGALRAGINLQRLARLQIPKRHRALVGQVAFDQRFDAEHLWDEAERTHPDCGVPLARQRYLADLS